MLCSLLGTLTRPTHLRCQQINATHVHLKWNDPPSLLGHENTTYVVLYYLGANVSNTTVNSSSLTFPRPATEVNISVTGWNPVGEGAAAYFDLTGCQTIGKI